ncbi:hypothetical protein O6H91_15G066300 [Diphasiastrum complanatum]|uniref:Uncharacterized protein n=1 Tax=Diphasiastrum complanatum TaxID=34168 RepID=A0ACC2BJA3_DIPCM|nr:hypothetical protein O6H91_15G066300 [Diphasiastrum complanatum]
MLLRPFPILACSSKLQCALSKEDIEANHMLRAAELADKSAGLTAPHPNAGCVLAHGARVVGEAYLYAQGTTSAEVQAVERAGEHARGATAYLNLEPGDCHGDESAVKALKLAGISRVVVGLRHPLKHLRGTAVSFLRGSGTIVDILGEDQQKCLKIQDVLKACELVNLPLLYTAAHQIPFSVLKYAMTLDGKIAASTGHAAWISSKLSRQRVFEIRGRSDAIIVGGNTVCRDNPQLTTRKEGGHLPIRIVMSRSLNLPEIRNLWDVSSALTIVMTQRGARVEFQKKLLSKGVEVIEFDFLTPKNVVEYCYSRGFLSILWECGGTLAAPAISSGIIHKVIAFLAPKIIGGAAAPSPVGELGMVEMTQALPVADVSFEQAQKFEGVQDTIAQQCVQSIQAAESPEEAARLGRTLERQRRDLVRLNWESTKLTVMYEALLAKFSSYDYLRKLLLSTIGQVLIEASPHDYFWGCGRDGTGFNHLGKLLMKVRNELQIQQQKENLNGSFMTSFQNHVP